MTPHDLEAIRALVQDERTGNAGRRAWAKRSHPEDEWRAMLDGAARTIDRLLDTLLSSLTAAGEGARPTGKACMSCRAPATREFCYAAEPWMPYCDRHEPQYMTAGGPRPIASQPSPADGKAQEPV